MATIRKQGIHSQAEARPHIGEDKSFGRASLQNASPRKTGLSPHNANAASEDLVLEAEVVPPKPIVPAFSHTRH